MRIPLSYSLWYKAYFFRNDFTQLCPRLEAYIVTSDTWTTPIISTISTIKLWGPSQQRNRHIYGVLICIFISMIEKKRLNALIICQNLIFGCGVKYRSNLFHANITPVIRYLQCKYIQCNFYLMSGQPQNAAQYANFVVTIGMK